MPPSARWFRLAAEQGYEKAQSKMASRYAKGRGVSANMVEALKWAILAAEQGAEDAARMRDDYKAKMPADQVRDAEERARSFRPARVNL